MPRDSTPHRIFKISELTRLIAGQLIFISPKGTVSLACACRYLEELVLNTLWRTQSSLGTLLRVLPEGTWDWKRPRRGRNVVCDLNLQLEGFIAER